MKAKRLQKKDHFKNRKRDTCKLGFKRNIVFNLGLGPEDIAEIVKITKPLESVPKTPNARGAAKSSMMTRKTRLYMLLFWLRNYPKYHVLATMFQVSLGTVSSEIKHGIAILFNAFMYNSQYLRGESPGELEDSGKAGRFYGQLLHSAIDGTCHPRRRVHPGQAQFFRSDKGYHFIGSQAIVSFDGRLISVHLFKGHISDCGAYRYIIERTPDARYSYCADGGYRGNPEIITPQDLEAVGRPDLAHKLRSLRVVVETTIGLGHEWQAATQKSRQTVERQELTLLIIYFLAAMRVERNALRSTEYLRQNGLILLPKKKLNV